jgi:hypothetical protein
MIRKHPFASFLLVLLASGLAYALLMHRATAWVNERWFDLVERRFVVDRSTLKPEPGERWFGMYRPELPWDYARYYTVAESLGVRPRIVSWYQSWGETPESEFKTEAVEKLLGKGLVPLITWEPWTSTFAGHARDTSGNLAQVMNGDFDGYIRTWARAVARVHKPILLRPMHEMGNPWYSWTMPHGNTPDMIAESWRHIVRIFREEGAVNAAFVWTPHIAADTLAWPGDEWVDWVGLDVFNYGNMAVNGNWIDFAGVVGPLLAATDSRHKPVLLAEVGSSAAGGDRKDWWVDAFRQLPKYPRIRALVVFDNPACSNTTGIPVDWGFTQSEGILSTLAPLTSPAGFRRTGSSR